jgi:hypothetical protein
MISIEICVRGEAAISEAFDVRASFAIRLKNALLVEESKISISWRE